MVVEIVSENGPENPSSLTCSKFSDKSKYWITSLFQNPQELNEQDITKIFNYYILVDLRIRSIDNKDTQKQITIEKQMLRAIPLLLPHASYEELLFYYEKSRIDSEEGKEILKLIKKQVAIVIQSIYDYEKLAGCFRNSLFGLEMEEILLTQMSRVIGSINDF